MSSDVEPPDEANDKTERKIKPSHTSIYYTISMVVLCMAAEYLSGTQLPKQRLGHILTSEPSELKFSANHAKQTLEELTAFGPRVTGSRITEIDVPSYLKKKLLQLRRDMPDGVHLEVSDQHPSSSFYLDFLGGMTNVYQNVTNVIAKLHWPTDQLVTKLTDSDEFSILINAHYDSIPGSPGASDDGIGVACMLEVIRAMSKSAAMRRPIIFLFNGAEESNHQAAHGFITQHPLAKTLKYVVNLESIGAGGSELVFQCNSGWLMRFYGLRVPHPHVSVIAHELFKYLLHRTASTDWSTLLKYGPAGIRGIDTAYTENGYAYHTKFDHLAAIPSGTFVNTGENLLYLAQALAGDAEVPNPMAASEGDEAAVFFDFLGYFIVSYSGWLVPLIHSSCLGVGVALLYMLSLSIENVSLSKCLDICRDELLSSLVPVLVGAAYGALMMLIGPMRWYNGGIISAALTYMPPVLLSIAYTRGSSSKSISLIKDLELRCSHSSAATPSPCKPFYSPITSIFAGVIIPWLIILVPCIYFHIMAAYISCLWILNTAIAVTVYWAVKRYTLHVSKPPLLYVFSAEFCYLLSLVPILLVWANVARLTFEVLMPLFGKSGTIVPTDPIVGALFGVFLSWPVPIIFAHDMPSMTPSKRFIRMVWVLMAAVLIVNVFFSHTYSSDRPKRLWIHHVKREVRLHPRDSSLTTNKMMTTMTALSHSHNDNGSAHRGDDRGEGGGRGVYATDCGIWMSSFDNRGMSPFRGGHIDSLSDGRNERNAACDVASGDCYLRFPWYFPVSEVLRQNVFIPTPCYSSSDVRGQDLQLILSSAPFTGTIDDTAVSSATATMGSVGRKLRIVRVVLYGPSHMNLIIRDNSSGTRLKRWSFGGDDPVRKGAASVAEDPRPMAVSLEVSVDDDRLVRVLKTTPTGGALPGHHRMETVYLHEPPPVRVEGIHFLQIGFGLCHHHHEHHQHHPDNTCSTVLHMLVEGDDPLDVAAYGHHIDVPLTAQLQLLQRALPDWAKGAEWTNFPSHLIRDVV